MRRISVVWLIIACLLLSGLGIAEEEAELTLMVYMCGSNLESLHAAASADLMEMAASGYNVRKVNLLIMTGGSSKWAMGIPTDALCVYQPGRGSLRMVQAYELMSMGEPEALYTLLQLGYERYPAKRYALVFWDHGGGPLEGICLDELHDSDRLTLDELTVALEASFAKDHSLEWIGFDACLMGSAEVASRLSPYARYLVASEETEPGDGWNYVFLQDIDQHPDGLATGQAIIDAYFDSSDDISDRTLALIDLSKTEALKSALDSLFSSLEITGGNYALYSYAARNTRAFGRGAGDTGSYDLVDLASLIDHLKDQRPEDAQEALTALGQCVIYSRSAGATGGLSVYHPYANKTDYLHAWGESYPSIGFSAEYASYVNRFAQYLFGQSAVNWTDLSALRTETEDVYALPLTDAQQTMLSSCALNVLSWDESTQSYASVCAVNQAIFENSVVYAQWNGECLVAVNASGSAATGAIPYTLRPDGTFQVYVNYCKQEALGSAEALRLIRADAGGLKKDYGSYSFSTDETEASSANFPSSGSTGTASSGLDEADTLQSDASKLTDVYGEALTVQAIAPYASDLNGAPLSVPETVRLDSSPVTARGVGSISLMEPMEGAEIVPVDLSDMLGLSSEPDRVSSTSYALPEDSLAEIELTSFSAEQVEINLTGFELPSGEAEGLPDVIHACLICAPEADGRVTVQETWLYEEDSQLWSTRAALDESVWSAACFPVVWKQPTLLDEALTGFDSWADTNISAEQIALPGWTLQFAPQANESSLCVSFQITDTQNHTYSSVPLMRG